MKLEFSRLVFEKYSNTKLYENLPSGRRFVPLGRIDKLTVAFRYFANSSKIRKIRSFAAGGSDTVHGSPVQIIETNSAFVPSSC